MAEIVSPPAGQTRASVRDAIARGVDVVVACGGDGTVHEVLQAVHGTGVAFAVAPCGTGNDIAGELDMPRRPHQSLALAIASGRTRWIDVGRVAWATGEEIFLGVLSTGFDSAVNERANAMRWPTGRARYLASVGLELGRFRAREYRVDLDGTMHEGRALLVCIANAGTYGGGMRVCPDAAVDDGLLDVTWVEEIPKGEFLRVLPRVFRGSHVRHPAVHTHRCRSAHIEAPGQIAYADGERLGSLPISVSVQPGALRIVDAAVA